MPAGTAIIQLNSSEQTPRAMVSGSRFDSSDDTARLYSKDWPKSRWKTMPLIHFQYCTMNGWPSP